MFYCSLAKKNSLYRESIEDYFYSVILYYINFYAFSYTIRDALKEEKERKEKKRRRKKVIERARRERERERER